MAHDQEVVGSNPGTLKKIENKGSQMSRPKKIFLQKVITSLFYIPGLCILIFNWGFSSQGYAKSLKTTQKFFE